MNQVPNISHPGCEYPVTDDVFLNCYFSYDMSRCYNTYTGECHGPEHLNFNNLCYEDRDPCGEKYDYICYYNGSIPFQDPSCALTFTTRILTSNIIGIAMNLDVNMLDPWGILISNDMVWVANTGTGLLTPYDLLGRPLLPVVNVFGPIGNIVQPTGICSNTNTSAFLIVKGPIILSSTLLTVTRDGTINGYNPDIDPNNCVILLDNSNNGSVYTGLTIVDVRDKTHFPLEINIPTNTILYVTDFHNRKIDVFDGTLNQINHHFSFVDGCIEDPLPEDYAPYNIVNINDFLFVLYAKQNPTMNQIEIPGIGHGFINIFTLNGIFVKRFVSRGMLNTPWGLVLVPSWFGYPSGSIMVSNFGDGTIIIFDADGKYLGKLKDEFLNDICISGIRGLVQNPNYNRILYWTASTDSLNTALLGTINTYNL
jgi:uncharacterized protein (TIGR03118 family)